MKECFRVLKTNGIIRVVVPDLEMIVTFYQKSLNDAVNGLENADLNYDWMMLELYDQAVRTFNGGDMRKYLNNPDMKNKDFVISRIGDSLFPSIEQSIEKIKFKVSILERIKNFKIQNLFIKFKNFRKKLVIYLVKHILNEYECIALQEGLFRSHGEIHRWMYDRFSLKRLLRDSNFSDITICQANRSCIPDFNSYDLDIINGKVRKPESLFMEAIKK
jgi:hypothetical protein